MTIWPEKLSPDPIAEALVEFRFTSSELPEVVVGKLASSKPFNEFPPVRLPFGEIPAAVRGADQALRFSPTLEFKSPSGEVIGRIGEYVASWHRLAPYPGWTLFRKEIEGVTNCLFAGLKNVQIQRLGLKYVDILTNEHFVSSIKDLRMSVSDSHKDIIDEFNLNFIRIYNETHRSVVRIASPVFVLAASSDLRAVIDIDVSTPDGYVASGVDSVSAWMDEAHSNIKDEFFSLLPQEAINKMTGRG